MIILFYIIAALGLAGFAALLIIAVELENQRAFERQCREHEHLRAELGRFSKSSITNRKS